MPTSVMALDDGDNPVVSMSRNAAPSLKSAYVRQDSRRGTFRAKYPASRSSSRAALSQRRSLSAAFIELALPGSLSDLRKSSHVCTPDSHSWRSVTSPMFGRCMNVCGSTGR